MRRRELIALFGGLAIARPLAADAQHPGKIPTIGILAFGKPSSPQFLAFRQGLRDLGWTEGESIVLGWREAHQKSDRLPTLAAELVQLNVDVIFAPSSIHVEAGVSAVANTPILASPSRPRRGRDRSGQVPIAASTSKFRAENSIGRSPAFNPTKFLHRLRDAENS